MIVEILPSKAQGTITAPSSKSCGHRLLIAASLASGESKIENIELNDDISATVACLRKMGAEIEIKDGVANVHGISLGERKEKLSLFCNESGSTLRFLIPLSYIISAQSTFGGSGRLLERPQEVYFQLFNTESSSFSKEGEAYVTNGVLKAGEYSLPGDVSSQYISGLLFALPLLDGDSVIKLTTPLQSAPYIDITIDVLSSFGVEIVKKNDYFIIKGNQTYKPQKLFCEGDWSNSAFLHAFNLFNGNVTVNRLNENSFQGDKAYIDFFEKLKKGYSVIDISACPDLGPVLIACSALLNGAKLTGTSRLKIKESDRGLAMKQELTKFGIELELNEDSIIIPKSEYHTPSAALNCHNDHRVAMSLAIMCSITGGVLEGAECVNKSYPNFFSDIEKLGINTNYQEMQTK